MARAPDRAGPGPGRRSRRSFLSFLRSASRERANGVDDHSLKLLELDRVTASIAARAASEAGARRLAAWGPIADPGARAAEVALLRAAIRRAGEPGEWCAVGPRDPEAWLEAGRQALDGPGLVEVLGWLEAGRTTRRAWEDDESRAR